MRSNTAARTPLSLQPSTFRPKLAPLPRRLDDNPEEMELRYGLPFLDSLDSEDLDLLRESGSVWLPSDGGAR